MLVWPFLLSTKCTLYSIFSILYIYYVWFQIFLFLSISLSLALLLSQALFIDSFFQQSIYKLIFYYEPKFFSFLISSDLTVCPWSSDPFSIVTYYIRWVTTSWTDGMKTGYETLIFPLLIYVGKMWVVLVPGIPVWQADSPWCLPLSN